MELLFRALFIVVSVLITIGLYVDEGDAAIQGTLSTTSTGSLNFSVTKPAMANITNLSDMSLSGWVVGQGAVIFTDDVCVYSTRPSGGYTVHATGSGGGGAFALSNGVSTIVYTLAWNSGGVGNLTNTGATLTADTTSGGLTNAATDSSTCNGTTPGPTARLIVNIASAQMDAATAGTFTGTITLMVTPN